ncbi:MAG: hypothetical protein B0D92_03970 [Spirochaeta sp. LUC14_002_19_P3]|nr:MAG: hypothetical protein B0D92_03970 [Spirochaeta sp. LUC14_002_19_P3]
MLKYVISLYVLLPIAVMAGTMTDESFKSYDPFVADKDGFDSLFVNPAGMANQTKIFSLRAEGGTWGKAENYQLLDDNVDAMIAITDGNVTEDNLKKIAPMIASAASQETLDKITKNTSLYNITIEDAKQPSTWSGTSQSDREEIGKNLQDEALRVDLMKQLESIGFNLEAEARIGTLIRGIGLGLYANTYLLFSLGALGIQDLLYETGIIGGYGFDVGNFSLGFSGKFATLAVDDPNKPFNMRDPNSGAILYGYAWGIDAGVIWEPLDSLRIGLVLNDIIGSKTKLDNMLPGTLGELINTSIPLPEFDYTFSLDLSMGITWAPEGGIVKPKFGLDFYNILGMFRAMADGGANYSGLEEFYQTAASTPFRYMRIGANMEFWGFLNLGANWYMEYITFGIGLDIAVFELFIDFKVKQDFTEIGTEVMFKIKF